MSEEINETTSLTDSKEADLEKKDLNIKAQIEEKLDTEVEEKAKNHKVRNDFKANLNALQNLLNSGLVTQQQGQNLLNHIIRTALDSNTQISTLDEKSKTVCDKTTAFEEFEKEKPDFFSAEGRSDLLKYLKSDNINFDKDELSKIVKIVEQVEKSAIDRYLKKAAHDESLAKFNSEAKQRLKANAQKTQSGGNQALSFTREQIGKMTTDEFLKNEKAIMDQLKKGLIK